MKIQTLMIIFIIITLPIISLFTIYLNLETKTMNLQTDYDGKLIEATKEAMESFEINTVDWSNDLGTLANLKRQYLMSSINVFTTSLSNKLRIGGTSKESILTYIPAIVFTMYDGYYIYAPTYVPQTVTDDKGVQLFYYEQSQAIKITSSATQNVGGTIYSGEPIYIAKTGQGTSGTYNSESIYYTTDVTKAKKTYKHVLKTFVPYTTTYGDFTINYTLDDYIRIYGENVQKEGYIIENFYKSGIYRMNIPTNSVSGIKFDGKEIKPEILKEKILIRNSINTTAEVKEYTYIYNSSNDKRYYDSSTNKFFSVNGDYVRQELGGAEYKKVLIYDGQNVIELYQLLNDSTNNTWYEKNSNGEYVEYSLQLSIPKNNDCSAINYYIEAYDFNKWLISNATRLGLSNIQEILDNKEEAIVNNINENLNLSISNYSANSTIDYKLPMLSDEDWEQALSNISIISFFQGVKIGMKTYNNYAVVSSTQNNEYVSDDSLYFMDSDDIYYHRYGCTSAKSGIGTAGVYKNTEFGARNYSYAVLNSADEIGVYYKHAHTEGTNYSVQECFDCIVNRNNFTANAANYNQAYYTALAREKYIMMQKTKLTQRHIHNYQYRNLGNPSYHQVSCGCGEIRNASHDFIYTPASNTMHYRRCYTCGYMMTEGHTKVQIGPNRYRCTKCNTTFMN